MSILSDLTCFSQINDCLSRKIFKNMVFPLVRLQRYRVSPSIRRFTAETVLTAKDFIAPFFVREGITEKQKIDSMPGVYQHTLTSLQEEVGHLVSLGLQAVILFGIPLHKDEEGTSSYAPEGIIQQAISILKSAFPHLIVIADCCLCEYTSHGHCLSCAEGQFDHSQTLETLGKIAVSYAEAGADIIAPSGMLDGMVRTIRSALNDAEFPMVGIMSYAIKYASSFYSPFREAAGSSSVFQGDRKHHQMAPSQLKEALREALLDVEEGADYLMVKPSLPYLDILALLKEKTLLPLVTYHTSGEYAMMKLAAAHHLLDEKAAFEEIFLSMKRAGAGLIITYYAEQILSQLKD